MLNVAPRNAALEIQFPFVTPSVDSGLSRRCAALAPRQKLPDTASYA
jgi:hypothetical protein